MKLNDKQQKTLKTYSKIAKSNRKYPSRSDMIKAGISWDTIRAQFGGMDAMKDKAREYDPKSFAEVIDPEYFDNDAFNALKAKVAKHKMFFITTAVAGAPIHDDFLASIDTFCKERKAMLLICPANYALYDMDHDLVVNRDIVFKGLKLNSNISISPVKIDPKQMDPTQSLDSVGQREGTILLASPKQRRRPVANSNNKLAHILQATGAITKPKYVPQDGIPKRRDFLAEKQHVMGGIIVEIVDDKYYHFRNVEMRKDGSFNDLFVNYSPEGVSKIKALAITQGDYHVGDTDPQADAVADELCRLGQPKYRIFHDLFDGKSINHHEIKNKVVRAIQANEGKTSLATEMHELKQALKKKLAQGTAEQLVVVKSNHDEFLYRYLCEGTFDDQNRIISTKLQSIAMEGKDPLKDGLKELFDFDGGNKIRWLARDEDFRISRGKIESGCHGDLGANGKRNPGSMGMLKAYGDCTYGHCHYGEINHGAMSVGTTTFRKVSYNRGASSWEQVHCITYDDGTRQLINCIEGKYRG